MIDAFASGGCFHSRTAMGMFEHVKAAVERGDCLLEWDYTKGEPPAPLLKDCFGSERRRAKVLNFSIAYGKTCLLYTSPSPRDGLLSRMPSSA